MSAIQPDLFLSHWLSGQTYQSALADISKSSRIPVRTAEEIHSSLGKLHPLLAANMVNLFPGTTISKPTHNPPRVKFRGIVCILCGRKLNDSESISLGIGPECVKDY